MASGPPRTSRGEHAPQTFGCPGDPSDPGPGVGAAIGFAAFGCEDFKSACNLPLAAQRVVGHTDRAGDVAEWLKAAVC